jgi:hypothetical protein
VKGAQLLKNQGGVLGIEFTETREEEEEEEKEEEGKEEEGKGEREEGKKEREGGGSGAHSHGSNNLQKAMVGEATVAAGLRASRASTQRVSRQVRHVVAGGLAAALGVAVGDFLVAVLEGGQEQRDQEVHEEERKQEVHGKKDLMAKMEFVVEEEAKEVGGGEKEEGEGEEEEGGGEKEEGEKGVAKKGEKGEKKAKEEKEEGKGKKSEGGTKAKLARLRKALRLKLPKPKWQDAAALGARFFAELSPPCSLEVVRPGE